MVDLRELERIARAEFADVVMETKVIDAKLRVLLTDGSYVDFWWSEVQQGRFAHHWNRLHVDGTIYRHDNSPHERWRQVRTFPQHYHQGEEGRVVESLLPTDPKEAMRAFLRFCRELIGQRG